MHKCYLHITNKPRRGSQLGLRKSNFDDALGRSEKMLWLSRSVCKRWLAASNEENL